jgi:hypothetical protein
MTMTDNDDPAPPRDPPSPDDLGTEEARREGRSNERRNIRAPRSSKPGGHGIPTDPEVPSAKRRGVLRRQRSLVGLSAVIVGLLSITLAVLYRASQRVGVYEEDQGIPSLHQTDTDVVSPPDAVREGTSARVAAPERAGTELGDDAPTPSHNVPAGNASSLPKTPAPATSIIRTPAF